MLLAIGTLSRFLRHAFKNEIKWHSFFLLHTFVLFAVIVCSCKGSVSLWWSPAISAILRLSPEDIDTKVSEEKSKAACVGAARD